MIILLPLVFMPPRTWGRCALIILLLLEVWLFSGSFDRYFNHDSLFYLIKRPHSVESFWRLLTAPDDSRQYRPLTLGFMGLFVPLAGPDPRPYHWIPLIFHLANTLLFYTLARRLLPTVAGALFAAAFWGLHSVAAWVTYDITCISDFMMAFLCLSSLLLAVEAQERRSWLRMSAALAVFALALLTKEAALPFPLVLWITLGLAEWRRSVGRNVAHALRAPLPAVAVAAAMSAALAALLADWLSAGMLYAQGTGAAYDINPWSNAAGKFKYLYWALNLPDALQVSNPGRARILVLALMGGLALAWVINALRRRGLSPVQWCGLLWLAGMMIPALMLSGRLAKWYLYMPLLGLGLAVGDLVPDLCSSLSGRVRNAAAVVVLVLATGAVLLSSRIQTLSYLAASDASYVSELLGSFVEDVRRTNPVLPQGAELFILPTL